MEAAALSSAKGTDAAAGAEVPVGKRSVTLATTPRPLAPPSRLADAASRVTLGVPGAGYAAATMARIAAATPGATATERLAAGKSRVDAGTADTLNRRLTALATACESTGITMGVDELEGVGRVGV